MKPTTQVRWETDTKYYEVRLVQDLFDEKILRQKVEGALDQKVNTPCRLGIIVHG